MILNLSVLVKDRDDGDVSVNDEIGILTKKLYVNSISPGGTGGSHGAVVISY